MENLFIECIKIELSAYANVSLNILANTIQYYAGLGGFNTKSIEYWHCVVSSAGITFQPNI
jgi:hypothetical protein